MRPKAAIWSPGVSRSTIRFGVSAFVVLALLVLATTAVGQEYNPARKAPTEVEQPATQRLIVKFRASSRLSTQATDARESAVVSSAARANAFASRTGLTLHGLREIGGDMAALEVVTLVGETPAQTLARLNADSEVEFAVPDRKVYASATSNDPAAVNQWYLAGAQASAINAHGAWDITTGGAGVVIAVIDTGIRFDHPDLQPTSAAGGKMLPGYDFVSGDPGNVFRTANDGDGRDSDPSDPGDWVSSMDGCGTPSASSWHGTRVSGIIGAMTNNSQGVAGINWGGAVLPVRVLGKCGGYNSDVLAGIRWAAGLSVSGVPANPNPAKVINVSLGSVGSCDAASANVIREVSDLGVLVVVAAGNEGGPVDSPANCPGAMAVLGLRHAGTKVGFSSLGPEIALGAPGGNCVNITAGSPCLFSIDTTSNSGTTTPQTNNYTDQINSNVGTSFSSPIVAGIAGLMLSVNSQLKNTDLIRRMKKAARPFPTSSDTTTRQCTSPSANLQVEECICNTSVCGAGMANALGSVQEAQRPIAVLSAPASVSQGVEFTLNAAGSTAANGRTIAGYAWTIDPGSTGTVTLSTTTGATTNLQPPASGFAVVRLTVTDNAGSTDATSVLVQPTSVSQMSADASLVTIAASDANAGEGGDAGVFTLTRAGSTTSAITVTYGLSGTATAGTDYATLTGTVSIPAGQTTATITVTPTDDASIESAETVVATLQAGTGYEVSTPSSATITIADNDTPAPPPASDGGGGGGGALDLLTLLGALGLVARAVVRRRAIVERR